MKDFALSHAARIALNHAIKKYGKMTSLKIDTSSKRLMVSIELQGEEKPIDINIEYRTDYTPDGIKFVATSLDCSREWMKELAKELLVNKPLPIPSGIPEVALKLLKI